MAACWLSLFYVIGSKRGAAGSHVWHKVKRCLPLVAALIATPAAAGSNLPGAPLAKVVPFQQTVQGIIVSDPYRWMEGTDPAFQPWLKGQARVAASWLHALPDRAALLRGITTRTGNLAFVGHIAQRGSFLFIVRLPAGAQTARLDVRPIAGGAERVLFDPASLNAPGATGQALNYLEPSPDGRYVYVGASPGGSEDATLRLIDTATGAQIDGSATQAPFNGPGSELGGHYPTWLPDSSGFFYVRLAEGARADRPGYYLNWRLFFHKVGTTFAADRLIIQHGHQGAPTMTAVDQPSMTVQPGSRWAVLQLADGVGRSLRVLVAPVADVLAGKAAWREIGSRADQILCFALSQDSLYLLGRDRPRGHVVRVGLTSGAPSLADLKQANEVVPQSADPLDQIITAGDGIYLIGRSPAGMKLQLLRPDGRIVTMTLPFEGTGYVFDGIGAQAGLFFSLENYVTPQRQLHAVGGVVSDTGLGVVPPFPVDAYVMDTVLVKAPDGAAIPLDIVHRRDTPRDRRRPVLLMAYGAYGDDVDPYFNPLLLALLDAGGVYAVAHVRGGGELGDDWWHAGFQRTKPNTWRDAIACGRWLGRSPWSSGRRVTIWGTSAGGIMVGRAVTEQPALWAGGVASVGILNAMRFEDTPNGKTNVAEFGTVANAAGARALLAMDAYLSIRDGVAYPPMLITAGANDPRVIDWQPAKFAARLEAASTGGKVAFRTDFDQGHGFGSTRSQIENKAADVFAFTLWAAARAN